MAKIPELPSIPFLGNIHDIDSTQIHASYCRLSEAYGEIFAYENRGQHVVVVNSHNVYDSVCDETVFEKRPEQSLLEVRNGLGDGLFTAYVDEPNWVLHIGF